MTERNQFTPYGQNPYQQQYSASPAAVQQERIGLRRRNRGLLEKIFGEELSYKMRTPLFATVSLFAVGAVFAAVIAISYPSGSDDAGSVPVIQAETTAFKQPADETGGMDVPYQDSTIFGVTRASDAVENPFENGRAVENLLEPTAPDEEAVNMVTAFADEAEDVAEPTQSGVESIADDVEAAKADEVAELSAPVETLAQAPKPKPTQSNVIAQTEEKIAPEDLMKKVETPAATAEAPKPEKLHAAGSSPETLAFVRSVLDQKDTKGSGTKSPDVVQAQAANMAATMNDVAPASGGNAINTPSITPGSYYVQLGSVTSPSGADSEWGKMQKSLPLAGLQHRVQEANLGDRGTYYRIQAGPMSKDSATSLCDQIKAQKPGGCLVVK